MAMGVLGVCCLATFAALALTSDSKRAGLTGPLAAREGAPRRAPPSSDPAAFDKRLERVGKR